MYDFQTLKSRNGTGSAKWEFAPEATRRAGVVPLSIADMELPVAPEITRAVIEAAEHGVYGYTVPDKEYFDSVSGWLKRRHGVTVYNEWISCTPGVVTALGIAVREFTQPGDGVIIQPPVYGPFWSAVRDNGRTLLENPLVYENGTYHMNFDGLEQLCARPEAKLMILCSPHNPVGRVWTADELMRVGELCKKHGVMIIADEIHHDIVFDGQEHTVFITLPGMADNCMLCTATSKTFNIAGLCCSNIFIPNKELHERFERRCSVESMFGIPYFARAATIAAYTKCDAWADEMLAFIQGNFEFMREFLNAHLPQLKLIRAEGTYLAWVDMRSLGLDDRALEQLTVDRALLALDEGYIFGTGGSGFERWNLALPRVELNKALERLEAAIKEM